MISITSMWHLFYHLLLLLLAVLHSGLSCANNVDHCLSCQVWVYSWQMMDRRQQGSGSLDDLLRQAVAADRLALSPPGHPYKQKASGPYEGFLTWSHLGELVSRQLDVLGSRLSWDGEQVSEALRKRMGLPSNILERQILLESLQRVFNRCFDTARSEYARTLVGPHNYADFLGGKQLNRTLNEFGFDPEGVGFFSISEWNFRRQLGLDNIKDDIVVPRPNQQDWIPADVLDQHLEDQRQKDKGSRCPTLVGYIRDTREDQGDELVLKVAKSRYFRHVGIRECLRANRDYYDELISRVKGTGDEDGLDQVIQRSPASNIVINVTVESRNGSLLLIKRPRDSRVWKNCFQVGPHETMNWHAAGSRGESCFELARRALQEEVGLYSPNDYYNYIAFSWFGYYLVEASGYFFAHVRTRLTEDELVESISNAEGRWEAGQVDFMNPTRENIADVLATWADGPWPSDRVDSNGRMWLPHATMSLTQLSRITRQGLFDNVQQSK